MLGRLTSFGVAPAPESGSNQEMTTRGRHLRLRSECYRAHIGVRALNE